MTPWFYFWEYIQIKPKTVIQKNICIPMVIVALFTIGKLWKQSKYPSIDKWIKKLWNKRVKKNKGGQEGRKKQEA